MLESLINKLKSIIKRDINGNNKIAIMCPCTRRSKKFNGDYFFCLAIKKYFERESFDVDFRLEHQWDKKYDGKYVLVLRGPTKYAPKSNHVNIMWNISHPTEITIEEYNLYDVIFIASDFWANRIRGLTDKPVFTLNQCTDHELFYRNNESKNGKLLFVGYCHNPFGRKIIHDVLPTRYDLDIFGPNWEGKIDKKYIKGKIVPNADLPDYYNAYSIVLNDHQSDMRNNGFVNNRYYDVFASGGFSISDSVNNIEGGNIKLISYQSKDELNKLIDYYLGHPEVVKEYSLSMQKKVLAEDTFQIRVSQMISFLKSVKLYDVESFDDES